jgi:hypothetical protein
MSIVEALVSESLSPDQFLFREYSLPALSVFLEAQISKLELACTGSLASSVLWAHPLVRPEVGFRFCGDDVLYLV